MFHVRLSVPVQNTGSPRRGRQMYEQMYPPSLLPLPTFLLSPHVFSYFPWRVWEYGPFFRNREKYSHTMCMLWEIAWLEFVLFFWRGIILFRVNNFSLAEGNIKGPSVGTDRWCGVVRTDARATWSWVHRLWSTSGTSRLRLGTARG